MRNDLEEVTTTHSAAGTTVYTVIIAIASSKQVNIVSLPDQTILCGDPFGRTLRAAETNEF